MTTTDLGAIIPALKSGMGDIDFAILQQFISHEPVAKGVAAVNVGDVMDYAMIIVAGKFGADLAASGGEKYAINTIGPGQWAGQMYFLEPGESSTAITALEDGSIGRLTREAFDRMAKTYPATADKLLHTLSLELSNRMRKAGKLLFQRFAWDQVEGIEGEDGARQWFTKVYCKMNSLFG